MFLQQLMVEKGQASKRKVVAALSRIDSVLQQLNLYPHWRQQNRMDEGAADRSDGRFLHHHTVEEDSSSWWMAVDGHFLALVLLLLETIAFKGKMT